MTDLFMSDYNNMVGKIGRQASGAVIASVGKTMVYSTVCLEREAQNVGKHEQ